MKRERSKEPKETIATLTKRVRELESIVEKIPRRGANVSHQEARVIQEAKAFALMRCHQTTIEPDGSRFKYTGEATIAGLERMFTENMQREAVKLLLEMSIEET